jgi:hypothetical protein
MKKRLPDLDQASLDCVREISRLIGVRSNSGTMQMRATVQIMIREKMREILPPNDPRKDRDYPLTKGAKPVKHARPDYDRFQDPAGLIPADEPVFLLRGQDSLAHMAVRHYAFMARQAGANDIASASERQAEAMLAWAKKLPDMPASGDMPIPTESNLVNYAKQELALLRGPAGEPDEMQDAIEANVLQMVEIFSREGHSGSSAAYTIGILEKVLRFEPLTPLTGADDEWVILDYGPEMAAQNKRCSHVFRRSDGTAYDSQAIVFEDPDGTRWNTKDSSRDITFPYTPTVEIVKRGAKTVEG